jgi:acetylornithine deacetylase/succinyl-diaminopimelate desuccinylase-like protein
VATRLQGGHANNALPQRAQATVNCRILPGHSPEEVRQTLIGVLADRSLTVQYIDDAGQIRDSASGKTGNPPPPLKMEVFRPLEKVVGEMWPGLNIIPAMLVGTSDGAYTNAAGLPTYSISGIALDVDNIRAHGQDENLPAAAFYRGNEFFYRYLKALTAN